MADAQRLFAIICHDKPGAEPLRLETRAAHFAHIEKRAVLDRIAVAGPLKSPDGHFVGSLFLVRATSEADARAFLEADPYFKAGIWADPEIRAFTAAAGEWAGGIIW